VAGENDKTVVSVEEVHKGDSLTISVTDGRIRAEVTDILKEDWNL
jgi:exonuclease VII large subunit